MQGAVTWEVLQWLVYGAIALVIFTAGTTIAILVWFQNKFNQIRDEGNERSTSVIHAVEERAEEIRSELSEFKTEVRGEFGRVRGDTQSQITKLADDWHEQSSKLRERVATVETIVARLPRANGSGTFDSTNR